MSIEDHNIAMLNASPTSFQPWPLSLNFPERTRQPITMSGPMPPAKDLLSLIFLSFSLASKALRRFEVELLFRQTAVEITQPPCLNVKFPFSLRSFNLSVLLVARVLPLLGCSLADAYAVVVDIQLTYTASSTCPALFCPSIYICISGSRTCNRSSAVFVCSSLLRFGSASATIASCIPHPASSVAFVSAIASIANPTLIARCQLLRFISASQKDSRLVSQSALLCSALVPLPLV